MLFFGCWSPSDLGHHLYTATRNRVYEHQAAAMRCPLKAGHLDTVFAPRWVGESEDGTELTHVHGWTVLAMWDRSADTRPGSNAAFLSHGAWTRDEMLAQAHAQFPAQAQRIRATKRT